MTTTTHRLVRDGQPAPRPAERRQHRPDQAYRCSCGERLFGTSRRQALPQLHLHRADLADAR
jgi:hypothetical protein